ncbi:MAG: hypothetical protein IM638_07475 [Bacteroidetes bacterium]|nr:hypothetical protein [Bacteroidota bacterium]
MPFWGAFVFTVFSEWLLFSGFSRYALKLTLFFIVLLNLVTWPVINWLYATTAIPLWQLETGVWLVESVIITIHWQWPLWRGAVAALLINAGSWGIGSVLEHVFFGQ